MVTLKRRVTHVATRNKMATLKKLYKATVTNIIQLSPNIKGYALEIADSTMPFSFKSGQWLDVYIPPDYNTVGGYSITCSPHQYTETNQLTLAIQYSTHPPTHWMHAHSQIGSKLKIEVGGDFVYNPIPSTLSNLLLLAGGIGINPLYSILHHQCHLGGLAPPTTTPPSTRLLYSACNENELIFKDDILKLSSMTSNFTYTLYSTRERPSNNSIKYGRITINDIKENLKLLPPKHTHCYICGPPTFINDMITNLNSLGINERYIHYEKWW